MMRKLFLMITMVISLVACSQDKKEEKQLKVTNKTKPMYDINQYIFPEAKDITEANFVEKLNSQIKHYDEEPIYYFRINKQNCLIRTYVNDVNIYDDYELSNRITPIKIENILKSGEQAVTIKMYPVGDLINQDLGLENEPPATKLSDKARVDIQIVRIDKKSKGQFADERVITTQVSPKEAAGKEYYEFIFTFQADVPYEFEGWTKGQDLRKLDPDLVRKKAVAFYEMVGQIYVNKDLEAVLKLDYPFNTRFTSSLFVDKQYLTELLDEYRDDINNYEYKMNDINNYDIEFMGNGKLIRLINRSILPKLKGGGALLLSYGTNGKNTLAPEITLYLPEGRDLATQGFMMWK